MWLNKLYTTFLILLMGFYELGVLASPVFGSYSGVLSHEKLGLDQNAKIDLISHRNNVGELKIIGILTLFFGDFTSNEYISYHFDEVNYNLMSGVLILSQPDQDITIRTTTFSDGNLQGTVRSAVGGKVGTLTLSTGKKRPFLQKKIISSLSGEYTAYCEGRNSVINLQTYRSTSDTVRIGNPFGAYKIKGQRVAAIAPTLCPTSPEIPCVLNQIEDGSYNFFSGTLELLGSKRTETCSMLSNGNMRCDQCIYTKTPNSHREEPHPISPSISPFPLPTNSDVESNQIREGLYSGYLYHERLGTYQRASLDILSYQRQKDEEYLISSVATVYFGDFDSSELLNYRFDDQTINLNDKQLVIERTERDVDAILKITDFNSEHIAGVWYSIIFGKVGVFRLQRTDLPKIPDGSLVMGKVSDEFYSDRFFLNLGVRLSQTPLNTENPFFPLSFSGYLSYQERIASRIMISGGSYDFYTGKIGLEADEGNRVFTGDYNERAGIHLQWMSKGFATVMQNREHHRFGRK